MHVTAADNQETYVLEGVNAAGGTGTGIPIGGGDNRQLTFAACSGRVMPDANDKVLVFQGSEVGAEGSLVCIDGNDAIFRDPQGEFRIVDVNDVAKIG